jgi:outer membrane biosynthesis protein TonB
MSNGWLIAADADAEVGAELAAGFELSLVRPGPQDTHATALAGLSEAANVGVLMSNAAARDPDFVALVRLLASQRGAQIILAEPEARGLFPFAPDAWPVLTQEEALRRARLAASRRAGPLPPPVAPEPEAAPEPEPQAEPALHAEPEPVAPEPEAHAEPEPEPEPTHAAEPEALDAPVPIAAPVAPPTSHDVFISYARADEDAAKHIARALSDTGLNVWLDTNNVGDRFPNVILEQLSASKCALVLWSAHSVKNEFVVREAIEALQQIKLTQAMISDTSPPPAFSALRIFDLRNWRDEARDDRFVPLLQEIHRQLGSGDTFGADDGAATDFDLRSEQIQEAKRVSEHDKEELNDAPAPAPAPASAAPEVARQITLPEAPPQPAPASADSARETADEAPPLARKRAEPHAAGAGAPIGGVTGGLTQQAPSAPADATAFAPKKLRRGESELVRIAVHQPKDLQAVIKAARKADPRTDSAPQSMGIGEVALGANVGVALEVRGGACDGALQRRTWTGAPLEFSFAVEADADVKQVIIIARVFIDDAQIGGLAFTRGVTGPRPKALPDGDRARLKRYKRVFLSYSSKDRETVSAIATAYQAAGIPHFWDRASLKSGEEWHPRLRREIDRCDLFHLCWSQSAAGSEWVEKEATHALGLKRRKKKPDITVQMLDGPPWAKHPDNLDAINFDDFVRAAIVGYARGDGQS